ncbi:MAG: right-handed parallel beta-helix repeat-containing protein [Planctomycetota bacterium]
MSRTAQLSGVMVLGVLWCGLCPGTTIRVDLDATGGNDGSSWADAYNELQSALAAASSGDDVDVAQGVYRPALAGGERGATFQLINGVSVRGGYAGFGEADPNARDIEAYETVLSGDIGGDDVGDCYDVSRADNSYHVVTGSGTDANAVLEGFTITGGHADGISPEDCGGGMYNFTGSPTVSKCKFIENYVLTMGGGMFNREGSSPVISNCTFISNVSDDDGGGIRNYLNCDPVISNCEFIDNVAFEDGGGINNRKNSNAIISNCVFIGNIAASGGGMENHVGHAAATGEVTVVNCLFIGNIGEEGGGMRNTDPNPVVTNCTFVGNIGSGMRNDSGSIPEVKNCIFRGNTGGSFDGSSSPVVTFSNIEGGFAGTGNLNTDPLFADTAGGDYHLKSEAGHWDANGQSWVQDEVTSRCVDAGDPGNAIGYELHPNGGVINMGAYGGTVQASRSYFGGGVCEEAITGDVNGDCRVDFIDFSIIAFHWPEESEEPVAGDVNGDLCVDFIDFGLLSFNWLVDNGE